MARELAEGYWRAEIVANKYARGLANGPAVGIQVICCEADATQCWFEGAAPDKCFAPEPAFKVGDIVRAPRENSTRQEFGIVVGTSATDSDVRVEFGDGRKAWHRPQHLTLIQRPSPCGNC